MCKHNSLMSYFIICRVSYRIFCLGQGEVFSHPPTKHVNVGVYKNLASLRLILVQF